MPPNEGENIPSDAVFLDSSSFPAVSNSLVCLVPQKKSIDQGLLPKGRSHKEARRAIARPAGARKNKKAVHPNQAILKELSARFLNKEFANVLKRSRKLLRVYPNCHFLWNLCGAAQNELGNINPAIQSLTKSINLNPEFPDALNNLGNAMGSKGKINEAIGLYNRALDLKPEYFEACYNLASSLRRIGAIEPAIAAYCRAIEINPQQSVIWNDLGVLYEMQGNSEKAINAFIKAIDTKPEYLEPYYNMANSLNNLSRFDDAIDAYRKAITIKPAFAEAHNNMGNTFQAQGKIDHAITAYLQALALKPRYPNAFNNLGRALQELGRFDQASEAYNSALAIDENFAACHANLCRLQKHPTDETSILKLLNLYKDVQTSQGDKRHLCTALYLIFDQRQEFKNAFQWLTQANTIRKQELQYNISSDEKWFLRLREFKRSKLSLPKPQRSSEQVTPIFIVGMPRSGTSLVEQILSCHSQIMGGGEIPLLGQLAKPIISNASLLNDTDRLREKYFQGVKKRLGNPRWFTDKMPNNFQLVPVIASSFPEAKIVHVYRNPYATCWSIFTTDFRSNGLGYSCELSDIAKYYALYVELMREYSAFYNDHIFHLNYEDLVEQPRSTIEDLSRFVGIDWEDQLMSPETNPRAVGTASNVQIRSPIYTGSSQSWLKYKDFIGDSFEKLPFFSTKSPNAVRYN